MFRPVLGALLTVLYIVILSSTIQAATSAGPFGSPIVTAQPPGLTLISTTALTKPFHTKGEWEFRIFQDPHMINVDAPGNLYLCLVRNNVSSCFDSGFNIFVSSDIKALTSTSREPSFIVNLGIVTGGSTNGRRTIIWTYNAHSDQFERLFDDGANRGLNEEVRVITTGPLAGDIVVNRAPTGAPYRYHILIYRLVDSQYVQILEYDGKSKYNDGNPMPVIDAEMAEIERRLHLWKSGDPLPIPVRTQCGRVVMKHGLEWCD
ncbi:MAG: hypothetical protein WB646_21220 [Steroidobacteraceae bacterium]